MLSVIMQNVIMLSVAAPYQDRLILLVNIILGWNLLAVTNTLAYYNVVLITTVKSFIA